MSGSGDQVNNATKFSLVSSIVKRVPFVPKLLLVFNASLYITFKTIRMVYLHFDFQITITN